MRTYLTANESCSTYYNEYAHTLKLVPEDTDNKHVIELFIMQEHIGTPEFMSTSYWTLDEPNNTPLTPISDIIDMINKPIGKYIMAKQLIIYMER